MIEDDENSVSANEVGFVLLPEKFQSKKNHIQHFRNSRLLQGKNHYVWKRDEETNVSSAA